MFLFAQVIFRNKTAAECLLWPWIFLLYGFCKNNKENWETERERARKRKRKRTREKSGTQILNHMLIFRNKNISKYILKKCGYVYISSSLSFCLFIMYIYIKNSSISKNWVPSCLLKCWCYCCYIYLYILLCAIACTWQKRNKSALFRKKVMKQMIWRCTE